MGRFAAQLIKRPSILLSTLIGGLAVAVALFTTGWYRATFEPASIYRRKLLELQRITIGLVRNGDPRSEAAIAPVLGVTARTGQMAQAEVPGRSSAMTMRHLRRHNARPPRGQRDTLPHSFPACAPGPLHTGIPPRDNPPPAYRDRSAWKAGQRPPQRHRCFRRYCYGPEILHR